MHFQIAELGHYDTNLPIREGALVSHSTEKQGVATGLNQAGIWLRRFSIQPELIGTFDYIANFENHEFNELRSLANYRIVQLAN